MNKTKTIDVLNHIIKQEFTRYNKRILLIALETVDNVHQKENVKQQAILKTRKINTIFSHYLDFLNSNIFEFQMSKEQRFHLSYKD